MIYLGNQTNQPSLIVTNRITLYTKPNPSIPMASSPSCRSENALNNFYISNRPSWRAYNPCLAKKKNLESSLLTYPLSSLSISPHASPSNLSLTSIFANSLQSILWHHSRSSPCDLAIIYHALDSLSHIPTYSDLLCHPPYCPPHFQGSTHSDLSRCLLIGYRLQHRTVDCFRSQQWRLITIIDASPWIRLG